MTYGDFKGLQAEYDSKHTLYVKPYGDQLKLTIDPANRHNGTEVLDGLLPRTYSTVGAAKGAATKLLDDGLIWKEIEPAKN